MWVDNEGKIHRNQRPVARPQAARRPVPQPAPPPRPAVQPVRPAVAPQRPAPPQQVPLNQQAQEIQRLNILVQQLNNQLTQERNQQEQFVQQINNQVDAERSQHALLVQQQANQINQARNNQTQVEKLKKQKKAIVIGFSAVFTGVMLILAFAIDFSVNAGAGTFVLLLFAAGIAATVGAFGEEAAGVVVGIYAVIGGIIGLGLNDGGFFAGLFAVLLIGAFGGFIGGASFISCAIIE